MSEDISRIVCVPDLLRPTRTFPETFFDLMREPIRQGCGIDIGFSPLSKRAHGLNPGFNLAKFRELVASTADMRGDAPSPTLYDAWKAFYYRMPAVAVDYLFEHLPARCLVLSAEIPPWFALACEERGQAFIDVCHSPLRFGRDLYLALRTSVEPLFDRIAAEAVPDEVLRLEAALLAANVRRHQTMLAETKGLHFEELDGVLLYVGQAPYDASRLATGGRSLRCDDFAERLQQLCQGRRLFYKSHPVAPDFAQEEQAALQRIVGQQPRLCQLNAYQILAAHDDVELVGISSGLLQEARWFDKTAHTLFQPFVPLAEGGVFTARVSQQISFESFLAPAFWHRLLTPARPAPRLAALPAIAHNHARETLNAWWDYSKVLTWERALPKESFLRSGGGLLRQRIEDLEQSVARLHGGNGERIVSAPVGHPDPQRWKSLDARHLTQQTDLLVAKELFKRSVRMVEIEAFSYCNRRCWFCSNASIDRISGNTLMPEGMYASILAQLASIGYDGTLTYSRYNEPLADKIILERIAEARRILPDALLHTNTNGDYLDYEYLTQLYDAGLRSLNIQIYLANNERYDHAKIMAAGEKTLRRVNLHSTLTRDTPGEWYERRLHYRDMSIRLYGRNFETNGTSRGGHAPIHLQHKRTSPCLVPFSAIYIDHDGSMTPCCNLRSDSPAHKDYVIGNLQTQANIFLHYTSRFAASFRASLIEEGVKRGLCGNCHYAEEPAHPGQAWWLARLLARKNKLP